MSSTLFLKILSLERGNYSSITLTMRKIISALVLALTLMGTSHAQDLITKNDGTDIKAKILEVSPTEVKYKNWDNQDGPTFIIYTSDILLVRYSNGTNQVFTKKKQPSPNKTVETEETVEIAKTHKEETGYYISNVADLHEGMRYKELKQLYDKNDYDSLDNPRYSFGWPWLNMIFPGVAQYTLNEPGLGTRFLCLSVAAHALTITGIGIYSNRVRTTYLNGRTYPYVDRFSDVGGAIFMGVGALAIIGLDVWSILNAYDIVKVKSLYHDDLMTKNNKQYSLFVSPTVEYMSTPNGTEIMPAVGLKLTF